MTAASRASIFLGAVWLSRRRRVWHHDRLSGLQPRPSGPLRGPARCISLKGSGIAVGKTMPLRKRPRRPTALGRHSIAYALAAGVSQFPMSRSTSMSDGLGGCRALNQRSLSGVKKALFRCILGPYSEYSASNAPQMALYDPPKSIRRQCPTPSYLATLGKQ